MKVVWAPLAEKRALEAVNYIASENPGAAAKWLDRLLERVGALDRFAKRGREVPELAVPNYREILHAPYRVVYRLDRTQVVILTLRHQRRAWDPDEVPDIAGSRD